MHLNGSDSVSLGIIKMKQKLKCKNSYIYVITGTKIRFHFQFPRSPDAAFGGFIGCFFNWKCQCSYRIIGNVANYLKHCYFLDGDGIDYVTLPLWNFSDFSSRHTVGVAGDDVPFHILVGMSIQSILSVPHTRRQMCVCVIRQTPHLCHGFAASFTCISNPPHSVGE